MWKWLAKFIKKPKIMKYWFITSTPTKSERVQKLIALGEASNIIKAIENEKSHSSDLEASGVGVSGGITVKRIGSVRAK